MLKNLVIHKNIQFYQEALDWDTLVRVGLELLKSVLKDSYENYFKK